ncbi:MAG: ribokinase [Actinomycetota bacterium]
MSRNGHSTVDVLVVGSLNLDLVARTERHPSPGETVVGTDYAEHPGGKGLNQAVAAARAGATVAMIGAVGDDAAGRMLREVLEADGIDHTRVATVGAPTGRAVITVDAAGENSIVVVAGANAHVAAGTLPRCSVVLGQLEVPLAVLGGVFRSAQAQGALAMLNPAPVVAGLDDLVAAADVVVPNEHEAALLRLRADGAVTASAPNTDSEPGREPLVIVTAGAAGVRWTDRSGRHTQRAMTIEPVDTTGAGDAFCGNLAARLAGGAATSDAIRWATAAGALATTVAGAVPSMPIAERVRSALAVW